GQRPGQLAPALEQLLLQDLHLPRRVRESATKECGLVLEELDLGLELVHLLLVALQLLLGVGTSPLGHDLPPWRRSLDHIPATGPDVEPLPHSYTPSIGRRMEWP